MIRIINLTDYMGDVKMAWRTHLRESNIIWAENNSGCATSHSLLTGIKLKFEFPYLD